MISPIVKLARLWSFEHNCLSVARAINIKQFVHEGRQGKDRSTQLPGSRIDLIIICHVVVALEYESAENQAWLLVQMLLIERQIELVL